MTFSTPEPAWIDQPWMYSKPRSPEAIKKWEETWIGYLIQFAEYRNLHVVNVMDLKREELFVRLDQESFQNIVQELIGLGYGKWWDKKKRMLRIYWRTLDGWAEHIFRVAQEKEKSIIRGVQGLVELEPKLVSMPHEEAREVLDIMVKRKLARWINDKERIAKVVY